MERVAWGTRVIMLKLLATLLALLGLLLTGCADEEDEDVEAFCAEFESAALTTPALTTFSEISDARTFFEQLEPVAPEVIEEDVDRVSDGLARLVEAFEESEGDEGLEALEAIQEAAGVDLDELAASAEAVQQFAVQACDVDPIE